MSLIDEAKIYLKAGDGGPGCVSFRREKFIEFGGPNGGDGGKGGDIIFHSTRSLNTLTDFRYKQHIKSKSGRPGSGMCRTGASAEDCILQIPVGTQIYQEDGKTLICDMNEADQEFCIAKGGAGGLGNTRFKSSTNRAPRKFTRGYIGEEKWVWLKLKLMADVGLVGLPNAGKSTTLAALSSARPKIANYPFTTLKPALGVVSFAYKELVFADVPGLISGASLGAGLGHKFLKHIERCKIILHVIDATSNDIVTHYNTIKNELSHYADGQLKDKKEIIALNKIDLLQNEDLEEKIRILKSHTGYNNILSYSGIISGSAFKMLSYISKTLDEVH
ncbi:MAG: GTPase ObgE [Proteobacteria bacterium]|nr:GTPase ObgE [Pseudomonadota bacterium]